MAVVASTVAVSVAALTTSAAVIRLQRRDIAKLQQQVHNLMERAKQFESVPKMMSMKRRESELTTRNSIGKLEADTTKANEQVATLQEQVEVMLEMVDGLQQKVTTLESVPKMISIKPKAPHGAAEQPGKSEASVAMTNAQVLDLDATLETFQRRLSALEASPATGCLPCGALRATTKA
uniref:Uncharacterized protein n=1 Tax=Pyrodinium bahamense TaxID=73915 RepID=A0A7S0FRM3_9DINO